MNIREFAALCGVSPSAVSRILNYPLKESRAAAATYNRVRAKAVECGFRPNYAAKTLHSRKSNCIGVIIGFPNPVNSLPIIRGIADYAYQHGFSVSVTSCGNDIRKERRAFAEMLYRRVDAIIWHPTVRRAPRATVPVQKMLQAVTKTIPVVSMNCNDYSGIFKFLPNRETGGVSSALRQLQLGCKKFAVIRSAFTYPAILVSKDAYIATLRENGVAENNIIELVLDDKKNPPDWRQLEGVEGLWMYYLFMLHALLPDLQRHCTLDRLHIDGQSFVEDYALTQWIQKNQPEEHTFANQFASLNYHLLDGTALARRAAEIAIQAIENPRLKPFAESIEWVTPSRSLDPGRVLFQM